MRQLITLITFAYAADFIMKRPAASKVTGVYNCFPASATVLTLVVFPFSKAISTG